MDAASLMDHGSKLWRAQQLEELQSRKKTVEAAAASGMSPTEQLRAYLSQHYVRVMDLLRSWDEDGNGVIDRQEFRQALPALGLSLDRQMIDELYDTFDADGSGLIDIDEMYEQLRHGAGIELDESLRVGANGEIETTRANKIALRQGLSGTHSTLVGMSALDANSDVPVVQQIQSALTRNFGRVIDVFREWDEDDSGTIDRREFRRALPLLGIHLDKQTAECASRRPRPPCPIPVSQSVSRGRPSVRTIPPPPPPPDLIAWSQRALRFLRY